MWTYVGFNQKMQFLFEPTEYKPSFGDFVDVNLTENKLSLRSLIVHSVVEALLRSRATDYVGISIVYGVRG